MDRIHLIHEIIYLFMWTSFRILQLFYLLTPLIKVYKQVLTSDAKYSCVVSLGQCVTEPQ